MNIDFKTIDEKEKINNNLIGKPCYICVMCVKLKHNSCFTLNEDPCFKVCDRCFAYDLVTDGYTVSDYYICEFCMCEIKVGKKNQLDYILKHHERTEKHKNNVEQCKSRKLKEQESIFATEIIMKYIMNCTSESDTDSE